MSIFHEIFIEYDNTWIHRWGWRSQAQLNTPLLKRKTNKKINESSEHGEEKGEQGSTQKL